MNSDHFVFSTFLRDEIDFAYWLKFVFIIWLVWDSALNCFSLWFFLSLFSFPFSYFSLIDRRFDHREIIISYYLFSLTITMRWSWNDRQRETKNCWKERHRLSCAVLRARLWIEKEWKSRKFWEQNSNFELRKEDLTLFSSDSKFDLFVLTFMICFVDFFQSEMMLLSSKQMKEDFEIVKFVLSNWSDDDVEIDEANWLKSSFASFDDDDFSNWQIIRVETIQKIVFLN